MQIDLTRVLIDFFIACFTPVRPSSHAIHADLILSINAAASPDATQCSTSVANADATGDHETSLPPSSKLATESILACSPWQRLSTTTNAVATSNISAVDGHPTRWSKCDAFTARPHDAAASAAAVISTASSATSSTTRVLGRTLRRPSQALQDASTTATTSKGIPHHRAADATSARDVFPESNVDGRVVVGATERDHGMSI